MGSLEIALAWLPAGIGLVVWLAVIAYTFLLATRLVRAVEEIARKMENRGE